MSFSDRINSISSLSTHLAKCPGAARDIVHFIRHLLRITQQLEDVPTREFLLSEADFFRTKHLPPDARAFVAKRVYAFWKKRMIDVLQDNLAHFPHDTQDIPVAVSLSVLNFESLPTSTLQQLEEIKQALSCPIPEPKKSSLSHEEIKEKYRKRWEEKMAAGRSVSTSEVISQASQASQTNETNRSSQAGKITKITQVSQASYQNAKASKPKRPQKPEHSTPKFMELSQATVAGIPLVPISNDELLQNCSVDNDCQLKQHCDILDSYKPAQISLKDYKDIILPQLHQLSCQHLLRTIKGIMHRYLYTTTEKYPLMRLKDAILRNKNLLTSPNSMLAFINHGTKHQEAWIHKFSHLTDLKELNLVIENYMILTIEQQLQEHAKNFRKMVEYSQGIPDFLRLLSQYPLHDRSLLRKYPFLKIILTIKNIVEQFQKKKPVTKLLNKFLGTREANMKRCLQNLLEKSSNFSQIRQNLEGVHDINTLFKHIKSLKEDPSMERNAETIFQMIVIFLRGRQQVSFQTFKTSLNFLSPALQQKIIWVVKAKLKRELSQKVQIILRSQAKPGKRWKKLLRLLQNPQFTDSGFQLFSYPLPTLLQKLRIISRDKEPLKAFDQNFATQTMPASLRDLVDQFHLSQDKAGQKTIRNSYRDLQKLSAAFANGEILSLKRPLTDLFKYYGQLNFSSTPSKEINGYTISRTIGRYYYGRDRDKSVLPQEIKPHLAKLLANMLEQEQERQLKKIQANS